MVRGERRKRSPPDGASVILRLSKRPLEETLVKTLNTNSILKRWYWKEKEVLQMVFGLDVSCTSYFILQQTNGKDASGKSKGKGKTERNFTAVPNFSKRSPLCV